MQPGLKDVEPPCVEGQKPSVNEYDWLGNGHYFWEGSPHRAWEWAQSVHKRRPNVVRKPFVLGAVIDLGNCFNLTDSAAVRELRTAYDTLVALLETQGLACPGTRAARAIAAALPGQGGD